MAIKVILTGSNANMKAQLKGMQASGDIQHGPVYRNEADTEDILGTKMFWRSDASGAEMAGSGASVATYRTPYRTDDGPPPEFTADDYYYWFMESEEDWDSLLELTVGQQNILPGAGGSRLIYASGLTVGPGIGNGDGTWGAKPLNGLQLVGL